MKLVIANWKMQVGLTEAVRLAKGVRRAGRSNVEVAVCPSYVHLAAVAYQLKRSGVALGAQDVFWERTGAYTGEVSPTQLLELGCRYVLVGHSERRQHLGETDAQVNRKVRAALELGLVPVVCVGETYEQRQSGAQDYAVLRQVEAAFAGVLIEEGHEVVVAYEPVWAIGTGHPVAPEQVAHARGVIRHALLEVVPFQVFEHSVRLLYGGSVDADTVHRFTALEGIDGVLVGTASLDAKRFLSLVQNT